MLTADLAQSWQRGGNIHPRYINADDANYLQVADDLIAIVREHEGRRHGEITRALDEYVGTGTDYRILRGLIKLLTDRCVFATSAPVDPVEIRAALFRRARTVHPVVDNPGLRQQIITDVAGEFNCAPEAVIDGMYADLKENERLAEFEEIGARDLLDRYNLAQAQALLYRCVEMQLRVERQEPTGYRKLFGAIKAYRLIHSIKGSPGAGYEVLLNGPVSLFHRSQKYGIQMAVFLPALLACQGWQMRAEISAKQGGSAFFELASTQDRLRPPDTGDFVYENPLLDKLIVSWAKLQSDWVLERSAAVIDLGASAFTPDMVFRHPAGKQIFLEALGFWTPRYLNERLREFAHDGFKDFILVMSEELRGSHEPPTDLPPNVIICKTVIDPGLIRATLDQLATEREETIR